MHPFSPKLPSYSGCHISCSLTVGLSYAPSDVELQPWSPPTRCQQHPFSATFVSRHIANIYRQLWCALEKEMATHSSVLAWRIPGMGEPGGLPSMGLYRVGHDWSDLAAAAAWCAGHNAKSFLCFFSNFNFKINLWGGCFSPNNKMVGNADWWLSTCQALFEGLFMP